LIVKSWRSFRTATLLRGLAPRDVVSATVSLDVGDLSLFQFRSLTSVVADLRGPRLVESDRVDGTRSAAATVRAGGYPSFVQALRASTPAYLLLVDVRGADDIMRALGDL